MKQFLHAACFSALWLVTAFGGCQSSCPVIALGEVQASGPVLSLADLLSPSSCPTVRRSAAQVRLGAVPFEGSVRIFEGDQIRGLLEPFVLAPGTERRVILWVPERTRVHRARPRSSCREIEAKVFSVPVKAPDEADCGAADRIPEDAPLTVTRKHWDPALGSWMFSAHCTRPSDCVPFLIRVPGGREQTDAVSVSLGESSAASPRSTDARETQLNLVVRPGDKASLLWDQDGIRLTIPAICMDKGRAGDTVRARLEPNHRIVRAVVVNAKVLRVQS